jgi:hypothetical protein
MFKMFKMSGHRQTPMRAVHATSGQQPLEDAFKLRSRGWLRRGNDLG